jgi:hypothetical protein
MAHLLDAEDLDEVDIGNLFDYLKGRNNLPERRRADLCCECDGRVLLDPERGDYVCEECGVVQPGRQYYVESWEDRERIDVSPREGYKQIHHWHERLAQYHLQETAICPDHWYVICQELLSARPKALTKESLRLVLLSVKLQRNNENWLQIIHRLTGYRPPPLSQRDLLLLDTIFQGVIVPFYMFKPEGRKNLLNYNFLLYRLLQLAGRKDTLCHFPQLKTKSKWEDLDRTWALICEYNDWEHWPLEPVEPGKAQWLEIATDDAGHGCYGGAVCESSASRHGCYGL